ncbi:MAG: hypothetical protein J6W73_01245, partial [Verrucomicrobia bacterium]|nr:hypothetical protein [Verrucomicrobiota bacterium]
TLLVGSASLTVQQTSSTEDLNLIQKVNDRLHFLNMLEAQFPDDEKMTALSDWSVPTSSTPPAPTPTKEHGAWMKNP